MTALAISVAALSIFIGLLAHFWGDYVTQNHWMANTKTQKSQAGWFAACVHATVYSFPFGGILFLLMYFFGLSGLAAGAVWVIILATHAFIDHTRLAATWTRFWGVGCEGEVIAWMRRRAGYKLEDVWTGEYADDETTQPAKNSTKTVWHRNVGSGPTRRSETIEVTPDAPAWLGVWLVIIVDNTLHIIINTTALIWAVSTIPNL